MLLHFSLLLASALQAEIVILELLHKTFDAHFASQAMAYGIGSVAPASRNARSRRMQLSQTPQATVSPE
jgi:hypothetical protein